MHWAYQVYLVVYMHSVYQVYQVTMFKVYQVHQTYQVTLFKAYQVHQVYQDTMFKVYQDTRYTRCSRQDTGHRGLSGAHKGFAARKAASGGYTAM